MSGTTGRLGRRARATAGLIAGLVSISLLTTQALAVPAIAAQASGSHGPSTDNSPVPSHDFTPTKRAGRQLSLGALPSSTRPKPGVTLVDLPADASFVQAGSFPIKLAKPDASSPVTRVKVRVFSGKTAEALGANELAFAVMRADGGTTTAPIRVALDFSQWRFLYGADAADRTSLLQVPICTDSTSTCASASPVTATKDLTSYTLTTDAAAALPDTSGTAAPTSAPTGSPDASASPITSPSPSPSSSASASAEDVSVSPTAQPGPSTSTGKSDKTAGRSTAVTTQAAPEPSPSDSAWTSSSLEPPPTPDWIPVPADPSNANTNSSAYSCKSTAELADVCQSAQASKASGSKQGAVVYAASTGPGGSSGTFAGTTVAPTGDWASGSQSGDFNYSYPLTLPPAANGETPEVTLGYSSQSVDGRTASRNNQASAFGLGWEYTPGAVTAAYLPCAQSGSTTNPYKSGGDLCHTESTDGRSASYSIDLGNRTSKLYLQTSGATSYWRLEDDPGSRVTFFNTDQQNSWWLLETSDGTKYYYGSNGTIPTPSQTSTQSRWTVPVFDGLNNSCHAVSSKYCNLPWKWNLDHVLQRSGAQTYYGYTPENNNYKSIGASATLSYTRGGYLNAIWYGSQSQYSTSYPAERVLFNVLGRCAEMTTGGTSCPAMNSSNSASFPDVPVDQICTTATCTTNTSPAFFTGARVDSISTQRLDGAYQEVDRYEFTFSFPAQSNDSATTNYSQPGAQTPSLFATSIAHRGVDTDATGASILLPPTTFSYTTTMANRVDYNLALGVQPMNMPRISSVTTDLGSVITPTYTNNVAGGACSSPNGLPTQTANSKLCFTLYFSPGGNIPAGWAWYHKYVVSRVDQYSSTADYNNPTLDDVTQYYYYNADSDYGSSSGVLWDYDHDPTVKGDKHAFSRFVGFPHVKTVHGATGSHRNITEDWYYTGLSGEPTATDGSGSRVNNIHGHLGTAETRYNDSYQLAGDLIRESRMDEGGVEISSVEHNKSWVATAGTAGFDEEASTVTAIGQSTGVFRYTRVENTYQDTGSQTGVLTQTQDLGAVSSPTGPTTDAPHETCTTYEYAPNIATTGNHLTSMWLTSFVGRQRQWQGDCASASPAYTSWVQHVYDNLAAWNTPPTNGDLTETDAKIDGTSTYARSGASYDNISKRLASTWTSQDYTNTNKQTTLITYNEAVCDSSTQKCHSPTWIKSQDPSGRTVTTTTIRGRGFPTDVVDVNGQHSTATYDTLGRILSVTPPVQKGHACPTLTSYTVSSSTPSSLHVQTPTANDGTTCTYRDDYTFLDSRGRVIEQQSPSPATDRIGGMNPVTTVYNDHGQVERVSNPFFTASTLGGFHTYDNGGGGVLTEHRTLYDNVDRPVAQDLLHNGARQWGTTLAYDGYKTTVTPPAGHPGNATSPAYDAITTTSDAAGRPVDILYASQTHATHTVYYSDGKTQSVTDPAGNTTSYTYDWLGRTLSAASQDAGTVTSAYDGANNLKSTTHAGGTSGGVTYPTRTISYVYDTLNRKTKTFDGPIPTTAPFNAGLLATYQYDTGGAWPNQSETPIPPAASGGNCALGRLVAATIYQTPGDMSTGVQTAYHYDNRGQVAYTMVHLPKANGLAPFNGNYVTGMTYNERGEVTDIVYPKLFVTTGNEDNSSHWVPSTSGCAATPFPTTPTDQTPVATPADTGSQIAPAETVHTTYDRFGLATSGTYASTVSYNTRDTNVSEIDAQGNAAVGTLKRIYSYDNVDTSRLAEMSTSLNSSPATQDDTFVYDSAGNLFRQHDATTGTGGGGNQCYTYDGLQRIIRSVTTTLDCETGVANNVSSLNRSYDLAYTYAPDDGNRLVTITNKTGATTYTGFDNTGGTTQMSAPKTVTTSDQYFQITKTSVRSYNPFTGELVSRSDTPTGGSTSSYSYAWNDLGQLTATTQSLAGGAQSSATNLYDVSSARLLHAATTGGSTESTLYLGPSEITATTGTAISFTKAKRYYAVGNAQVAIQIFQPGSAYVSYAGDDRQGSAQTSVDANSNLNRDAYTPFGTHVGTRTTTSSHDYVGAVQNSDSNLLQMGARYYDADAGTFISPDPLAGAVGPLSLNPYSYADNNPVAGSDPSGLATCRSGEDCVQEGDSRGVTGNLAGVGANDDPIIHISPHVGVRADDPNAADLLHAYQSTQGSDTYFTGPDADAGNFRTEVLKWNMACHSDGPCGNQLSWQFALLLNMQASPDDVGQIVLGQSGGAQVATSVSGTDILSDLAAAGVTFTAGLGRGAGGSAQAGMGPGRIGRPKPVNLPAWRKVFIDMDHIQSGHMSGGSRVSPQKTLFPDSMTNSQVESAIRQAYRFSSRVRTQDERTLVRGSASGLTIEMWVNRATGSIVTAYPVGGP